MSEGFLFELILPEKTKFSGEISRVSLPGSEGVLTVMKQHTPLTTTLIPGILQFVSVKGEEFSYVVFEGVVRVTPSCCIVLTEDATLTSEFDSSELEKRIERAREELDSGLSDEHRSAVENFLHQLTTVGGMLGTM